MCGRLQRKVGTKRPTLAAAKSPISSRLDLGGFFDSDDGRRNQRKWPPAKEDFRLCREKRKRQTERGAAEGNFISSWKHTKGEGAAAAARAISSLFHKREPRRSKSRRRRHIFTGRGGHFHRSTHQPRQFAYLIRNGPIHVLSGSHSSLVLLLGHSFGHQPLEGARISRTQTSWAVKSRFPFWSALVSTNQSATAQAGPASCFNQIARPKNRSRPVWQPSNPATPAPPSAAFSLLFHVTVAHSVGQSVIDSMADLHKIQSGSFYGLFCACALLADEMAGDYYQVMNALMAPDEYFMPMSAVH
jgi:hypothetical protein